MSYRNCCNRKSISSCVYADTQNGKHMQLVIVMTILNNIKQAVFPLVRLEQSVLQMISHTEGYEELLVKSWHPLLVDGPVQDTAWTEHASTEEECAK